MRFYLFALFVIVVDQASKIWVRLHLKVGDSIVIWDPILHFTRYENSGIAKSMLQGYGRFFVPVAAIVVALIVYYRRKGELKGAATETGAALLAGGAIGNGIDRLLYNHVTDYISFSSSDGILNFADYAITGGGMLIVFGVLIEGLRSAFRAHKRAR